MEYFDENCVTLRMASFCLQIVLWGSFDRFLSIFFKKIKILEKIMIFVYQHGAWVLVVSEKSIKDYQKSSFFISQRTYLSMRYDVENILKFQIFYFISKVWEKSFSTPGRTSLCDKNSRFWFELKFLQKLHFRPNA